VNIGESNNSQRLSTAEPIKIAGSPLTPAYPKRKRHNAKLCPLLIREGIVNALAAGDSKRAIARALRVSNNTVTAVAEQEWQQVETRKARIAAQAERAATRAFERINDKLDSAQDIPLNILVPVAGVSVDKTLALRGEPTMVARIDHFHRGNVFQAYAELTAAIKARVAQVRAEQPVTAQLALPNGEAVSDSDAETRP
jgi:DNA-binding transcriptional MocR family regulator